jgi:glycerol uptake facilitator-like aquaporin
VIRPAPALVVRRTGVIRRALAEFLGTGLLVAVVVGSGIAATDRTSDGGLQLLINSTTTALGLAVLILIFAPVSGAHFNPVITLALRRDRETAGLIAAQCVGAIGGAVLADAMFGAQLVDLSSTGRGGARLMLAEVVATAGLVMLIVCLVRTGRTVHAPWSVGAYIGAAYWFTSSTSFANPAVTIGRIFSDTYAGIAPGSAPGFIAAELVGGAIGFAVAAFLHPSDTMAA